jgi:formate-dependent nitrite reductase cytochrome c552 subunit
MKKITKRLIAKDHPDYETIGGYIHSKESVVGIDARHTHIVIIKKLTELEEKLDTLLATKKKKTKKR